MKIVYINRSHGNEIGGASQVMIRNRNVLESIVGINNVFTIEIPRQSILKVIFSILSFGSYGLTKKIEDSIVKCIKEINPDYVFIEGTSYGRLYKQLYEKNIKTICFAHNFDSYLAKQELKSRLIVKSLPKYLSIIINERKAAKYADKLICLTERDSNAFDISFGRAADIILPISFPSRSSSQLKPIKDDSQKPYLLFVGSDFFPNVEGLIWFINNVAPYIKIDLKIVGSCCDNTKISTMKLPQNVHLVGYSNNIELEYRNSIGVIAPIFKGSGMKTKTIEALSYGKSIFGTDEAFVGIKCDYNRIGGKCNSKQEFIDKLNSFDYTHINEYSSYIFNSFFTNDVFNMKLAQFLNDE